jgi:hypothetical protein
VGGAWGAGREPACFSLRAADAQAAMVCLALARGSSCHPRHVQVHHPLAELVAPVASPLVGRRDTIAYLSGGPTCCSVLGLPCCPPSPAFPSSSIATGLRLYVFIVVCVCVWFAFKHPVLSMASCPVSTLHKCAPSAGRLGSSFHHLHDSDQLQLAPLLHRLSLPWCGSVVSVSALRMDQPPSSTSTFPTPPCVLTRDSDRQISLTLSTLVCTATDRTTVKAVLSGELSALSRTRALVDSVCVPSRPKEAVTHSPAAAV